MSLSIKEVKAILVDVGLDMVLKQAAPASGRWDTYNIIDSSQPNEILGEVLHTEGPDLGTKNFVYPDKDVFFTSEQLAAFTKIVAANN